MAVGQRRPTTDVIHHSDQGCQYTSIAFGARCREAGVRPSMGSVGDCFDNAMWMVLGMIQNSNPVGDASYRRRARRPGAAYFSFRYGKFPATFLSNDLTMPSTEFMSPPLSL